MDKATEDIVQGAMNLIDINENARKEKEETMNQKHQEGQEEEEDNKDDEITGKSPHKIIQKKKKEVHV